MVTRVHVRVNKFHNLHSGELLQTNQKRNNSGLRDSFTECTCKYRTPLTIIVPILHFCLPFTTTHISALKAPKSFCVDELCLFAVVSLMELAEITNKQFFANLHCSFQKRVFFGAEWLKREMEFRNPFGSRSFVSRGKLHH